MILLRLISWQYVRKHLLRSALTLTGIILGVAVFVGMHTANQSVVFAFQQTIDRIAGSAQLQVSAGEIGFPEEVLERVQSVPGVRAAAPVIEAVADAHNLGTLLVLGVDMLGDRNLRDYDLESDNDSAVDDPLVFLARPDSLMISRQFAGDAHLKLNDALVLSTLEGDRRFIVRGIMKTSGLASAFGGKLAVMDIYAAQKMFGRGRRFDRIDLAIADGRSVDDVRQQLERLLGPGFQVQSPASRGREFESISSVYRMSANISSVLALFIGMFIIYNTFSIAVAQRRSEIGILRALGATQTQIRILFLVESAIAGGIASAVGVLTGIALARGMASYIGGLLGEVYGIADRAREVSASPSLIIAAIAIGVATSVIAAIIPARNAASTDPVVALQKGRYQTPGATETRARRVAAGVFLALSLGALSVGARGPLLYLSYASAVAGALFLVPTLALWLSKLIREPLRRLLPVEGSLAADSLIQAPRRTSGVVSALMLSLGLVIALGGVSKASYMKILDWLNVSLNPDLFISASQSLVEHTYRFPGSLGDRLRAVNGVEEVQAVRDARIQFRGSQVLLVATDMAGLNRRARNPAIEGDTDRMYKLASQGKGAILADNLALLKNIHVNDLIQIPSPKGILTIPVVGITLDYSDQQGAIFIDRSLYVREWADDSVNVFRVYLHPGADENSVVQAIPRSGTRMFIFTNRELRAYILRITDQWFGLTYIQIAVAVLIAVLGIVNTLTVSITDRRRELGVLQAVGALRNQIRRTVRVEALAIGFIGLCLGLMLGAVQLYFTLEISRRDLAGVRLDYTYPVEVASMLFPVILGSAFLAALGPSESAVRGSLVESLEYE